MMVFTKLSMKSSAIHCQLVLIVNKTFCKTCCPDMFNCFYLDRMVIGLFKLFEEMFGEAFWKETAVVFFRLSMKSSAI